MKEKVVLLGAGSAMFTRGLLNDLVRRDWDVELGLVDVDAGALAVAAGLARKIIEAKRPHMRLQASTDRRPILKGATVVVCTVGVGGRRAWEQDVFIPRKYGIFQPVGDTVMPGGSSRALRMIPAMVDIAKDLLELAPHALFFNYGNPITAVCRAVHKATGADIIGLCHGVHAVAQTLAKVLGAPPQELTYTAVGLNHLTWFTDVRVRGVAALPRLKQIAHEKVSQRLSAGEQFKAGADDYPFTWHMLDLFGAFPCVLDRHIVEFFPWMFPGGQYYGKKLGLDAYSFEDVITWGDKVFEQMKQDALSPRKLDDEFFKQFGGEHEQVIDIVESVRKCDGRIYSANLPNQGQVPNLPADAVLEAPALAAGGTLKAIQQGALPAGLTGTLATRLAYVETLVEAALEGSREKFIQALVLDGAVTSLDTATRLADELLKAQAQYLPQFKPL